MPAYDENWIFSLFFVTFLTVNLYIFMNIILATIYINYKKHLKEEVRMTIALKRTKVNEAFEFIKDILSDIIEHDPFKYKFETTEFVKSPSVSVITYEKFSALMKRIYPQMPANQLEIIFHILDSDENQLLSTERFYLKP